MSPSTRLLPAAPRYPLVPECTTASARVDARGWQDGLEAFLPLAGLVDLEKEKARLNKQLKQLEKDVEGLAKRLSSPGFKDKAPAEVLAKAENELMDKTAALATVKKSIADIEAQ